MNPGKNKPIVASVLITILVGAFMHASALISVAAYSFGGSEEKNRKCLECHGSETIVGPRYFIDHQKFGQTTHARIGCRACHERVTESHPDGVKVAGSTTCGDCHDDVIKQYGADLHSAKASCDGCHNPHKVYKASEISGHEMNRQCAGCHEKAKISKTHSRWLPQTDLHIGAVTCVTCHSRAENYVISIYVSQNKAKKGILPTTPVNHSDLLKLAAGRPIQELIDRNRDSYISIRELQMFNKNPAYANLSLRGMLTPVKPTHSFRRFDNRWNCTFCHGAGPEVMQTSYLCLPQADGTFTSLSVEKGAVLDALQAIPDFYLIGSTRNPIVDKAGFIILAGGLIMPIGHGFLRFLTRKFRS